METCYWYNCTPLYDECRLEEDISGIKYCDESCPWFITNSRVDEMIFAFLESENRD